jgi:hypothetical protein
METVNLFRLGDILGHRLYHAAYAFPSESIQRATLHWSPLCALTFLERGVWGEMKCWSVTASKSDRCHFYSKPEATIFCLLFANAFAVCLNSKRAVAGRSSVSPADQACPQVHACRLGPPAQAASPGYLIPRADCTRDDRPTIHWW